MRLFGPLCVWMLLTGCQPGTGGKDDKNDSPGDSEDNPIDNPDDEPDDEKA